MKRESALKSGKIRYILFYHDTPLAPGIPLKALTSQGKRLDVACRSLKAAFSRREQQESTMVDCWFIDGSRRNEHVHLTVDGETVPENVMETWLFSEIGIASFLDREIARHASHAPGETTNGISIETFFPGSDIEARFIQFLMGLREDHDYFLVLLHESGEPFIQQTIENTLSARNDKIAGKYNLAFIIGDHLGFPESLRKALTNTCDITASLGTINGWNEKNEANKSYLGSQVVQILQILLCRDPTSRLKQSP